LWLGGDRFGLFVAICCGAKNRRLTTIVSVANGPKLPFVAIPNAAMQPAIAGIDTAPQ